MRVKRLLPLAALLIVLIIAVVVFKRQPVSTRLSQEVGLKRLVPQSLSNDTISGVDLYQGEKADEAVRLRRQDDTWIVTSHYNAPALAGKITGLLDAISTLEGEVRSEQAELLGDFRLEDQQALHLLVYTTNTETPVAHLLAGKGSRRNGFMRVADDPLVYSVNVNMRGAAGLRGEETDQALEAKPWLNLQLNDIPEESVTALELHMPNRRLHFTLEKPPSSAASDEQTSDQETAPPAEKAQWKLIEPDLDYEVKHIFVESVVSTLKALRGEDIVAPDKLAEYGLDAPPYRVILTVQPEDEEPRQISVQVGHEVPEQDGQRYARSEEEGPVYTLPQWAFDQSFPNLGKLLTIDVLSVPPQDVTRLTWQQEEQSWTLERQASVAPATDPAAPATDPATPTTDPATPVTDPVAQTTDSEASTTASDATTSPAWRFVDTPEVTVADEAVTFLLDITKALTADDWFETPPEQTGLDQPALSLVLTLRDGQTEHLTLGKAVGDDDVYYASLEGTTGTFVISDITYKSLMKVVDDLNPAPSSSATTESQEP